MWIECAVQMAMQWSRFREPSDEVRRLGGRGRERPEGGSGLVLADGKPEEWPRERGTTLKVDDPALGEVREALRGGLGEGLLGLVLFGSAARWEAREGSDWDLLLVAEKLPDRFLKRQRFLRGLLPSARRGSLSFIAKTRAEFEGGSPRTTSMWPWTASFSSSGTAIWRESSGGSGT